MFFYRKINLAEKGWGEAVNPRTGTVEGRSDSDTSSNLKVWSIAVKKSKVFILASNSPRQTRFPNQIIYKVRNYYIIPAFRIFFPISHQNQIPLNGQFLSIYYSHREIFLDGSIQHHFPNTFCQSVLMPNLLVWMCPMKKIW